MDTGSVQRSAEGTPRTRNSELAGELRAAAVEGDDVRVTQLLSDLLHLQGLSRGQRISMQLTTLLNMVHSLRCVTLTDELTGHFNPRRPLSIDKLLESAEQAMYEHKKGLPDRVVRDDPPPGLTRF